LRSWEWLTLAYFAWLVVASWVRPLSAARRLRVILAGVGIGVVVVWVVRGGNGIVRQWVPLLYILAGYFASGCFFVGSSPAFEAWLMRWDRRWFGDPPATFAAWPLALRSYLEVVYMGCFLLVPAGFAALLWMGRADLTDQYWTVLVATEFGSFASLALVSTRPPWVVEHRTAQSSGAVDRLAAYAVRNVTIGANTFPSGHAAGSLGVAFAVLSASIPVGAVFLVLAIGICIACVAGRYHYAVDVIAGAALAIAVGMVVLLK
jgi:membrane-associated phospholipid phosphatase